MATTKSDGVWAGVALGRPRTLVAIVVALAAVVTFASVRLPADNRQVWLLVIEAFAVLFTALIAGLLAVLGLSQYANERRAAGVRSAAEIARGFENQVWKDGSDAIYSRRAPHLQREPASEREENFDHVLRRLEAMGMQVQEGAIAEATAYQMFGELPLRIWLCAHHDIAELRRNRGERYARNLQEFAQKMLLYKIRHEPLAKWGRFTPPTKDKSYAKTEDLVQTLVANCESCDATHSQPSNLTDEQSDGASRGPVMPLLEDIAAEVTNALHKRKTNFGEQASEYTGALHELGLKRPGERLDEKTKEMDSPRPKDRA